MRCEICGGEGKIHRHHWSYEPEHADDLILLCVSCHRNVHAGRLPEPRTGKIYNTNNGKQVRVRPKLSKEPSPIDIAFREFRRNNGKALSYIRKQRTLSGSSVAKAIGVGKTILYAWENGDCSPSTKDFCNLAEVYSVPFWYLRRIGYPVFNPDGTYNVGLPPWVTGLPHACARDPWATGKE